jgi:hypothetical protein
LAEGGGESPFFGKREPSENILPKRSLSLVDGLYLIAIELARIAH